MPLLLSVNLNNYLVENDFFRSPLGLILGIQSVVVGHFFTLFYYYKKNTSLNQSRLEYVFNKELIKHLTKPEGLIMLGGYLSFMWMYGFMPTSYYSFKGGINWLHVMLQLVIQDFIQYFIHLFEHRFQSRIPLLCHKLHHRFIYPKLFDAYDGSISDTFLMIIIPLFITSRVIPSNTWSYIVFGCIYANWLALIHSEYEHPWDNFFKLIGFGTPSDHHVHHKLLIYNYGHLFMYWDELFGTYRDSNSVPGLNVVN
jgi:sterol desaturase/sphingolipid hydroxylase (fatty acid hydroxylase superfamily)